MDERFTRTEMLLGTEKIQILAQSHVTVFGLGGVGSFAAEALARTGVGSFTLVDHDIVVRTNINRQLHALDNTVGMLKAQVMAERIRRINPKSKVDIIPSFYLPGMEDSIIPSNTSLILDAIDTVTSKIGLAVFSHKNGIPLISSMGTGNKLNPSKLKLADIYETTVCPLAKVMRKELRKRNIPSLRVVYSTEEPLKPLFDQEIGDSHRTPGSIAFVPSVAGLLMASEAVKILTKGEF